MDLSKFPKIILKNIIDYLDIDDLKIMRLTCKRIKKMIIFCYPTQFDKIDAYKPIYYLDIIGMNMMSLPSTLKSLAVNDYDDLFYFDFGRNVKTICINYLSYRYDYDRLDVPNLLIRNYNHKDETGYNFYDYDNIVKLTIPKILLNFILPMSLKILICEKFISTSIIQLDRVECIYLNLYYDKSYIKTIYLTKPSNKTINMPKCDTLILHKNMVYNIVYTNIPKEIIYLDN